jgi:hypothetical protein
MQSLIDEDSYILVNVGESSIYIQCVNGLKILASIRLPSPGEDGDAAAGDTFIRNLQSQLIMVLKSAAKPFVYLSEGNRGVQTGERIKNLFGEMQISYQELPCYKYERAMHGKSDAHAVDVLPLFGMVQEQDETRIRVNLLKDEFRPRMKGYVSVREFIFVGGLLLVLVILSTSGLLIDMRTRKRQMSGSRERVRALSSEVYGDPSVTLEESKDRVRVVEERLASLRTKTDARFSALQLLKEISLYLPEDVVMEYTDLIIERERIKFSGKARTFSDIDKIREELLLSEYFTDVAVSNTGTTGSTEGFTVTFVFDIEVVEELQSGN